MAVAYQVFCFDSGSIMPFNQFDKSIGYWGTYTHTENARDLSKQLSRAPPPYKHIIFLDYPGKRPAKLSITHNFL